MKKIILYIIILLVTGACYDYDERQRDFDRRQLPQIQFSGTQFPRANGIDTVLIDVSFPLETDSAFAIASFKTDGGVFVDGGKQEFTSNFAVIDGENAGKTIRASLKMPTSLKPIKVRVEVPNIKYFIERVITPAASLPMSMKVEGSKIGLQATFADEVILTAAMRAQPGFPNEGTKVKFVVADSLDSDVNEKYFRSVKTSNANGEASVIFTAGNFNGYRGQLKVTALTQSSIGTEISDVVFIQLIEPR